MDAGSYGSFASTNERIESNSEPIVYVAAFLGMGYAVLSDNLVLAVIVLVLAVFLSSSEVPYIPGE